MERWQNKVAVVTGASSGIGEAIVKDLVRNGLQVIGLARRLDRMENIKKQLPAQQQRYLTPMKCDISDSEAVNQVFDKIIAQFGGIDIMVNNAGCMKLGQLTTMDAGVIQQVLQTNVMGVIYCTQRAFQSMKERNVAGHVIIINSIAGHGIVSMGNMLPETNIYSPTKFALRAATEIYRQEFKGFGTKVKVTSISPGAVETEIIPDSFRSMIGENILRCEDISSAALYAISTPPNVQIHEMIIKPVGEMF
ncbi:farnesol dehydrogenase [Stomoxys calcitrans]|uniref:Dehydrogenase n=1 Tax=Stomoxys calcitrans TaxID=35570 RepID=A0A1I8NQX2_STOCA|nr:farnesol dehydrogenase [Stomoxys calcitrans]